MKALTPHFNHTFEGRIWKILPDEVTGTLALEIRKPENLQVTYYALNAQTGNLALKAFMPEAKWWSGLEAAFGGYLYLHGFAKNQQDGRHLGIEAVSVTTGQIAWSRPKLRFLGLISERFLLAENKPGQIVKVRLDSGSEELFSGSPEDAKTQVHALEERRKMQARFPVPFLPADSHYAVLQNFIGSRTGRKATEVIEYLETETAIVLSFYTKNGTVLANYLAVCTLTGDLSLEVCLEAEAAGLGMDTFFIFAGKLIFIQEKTGLTAFQLS